jgi:hypothetical protein
VIFVFRICHLSYVNSEDFMKLKSLVFSSLVFSSLIGFSACQPESDETLSMQQSALTVCGLDDGTVGPDAELRACAPGDDNKTTICHVPPGNLANPCTLCVGNSALKAHLANHSDSVGPCGI